MTGKIQELLIRFTKPIVQIEWVLIVTNIVLAVFVLLQRANDFLPSTSNFGILIDQYELFLVAYLTVGALSLLHIYFLVCDRDCVRARAYLVMAYAISYMFTTVIVLLAAGYNHILWINRFSFFWIAGVVYLGLRTQYAHADK